MSYSYDEYLAYERDSDRKREYVAGEIFAMAGGSPRHSALASRVSAALESTRGKGSVAFQSDLRVRVPATGKTTYPDASVVCGPIERDPADPSGATITNPTLLVEVLSPSTEEEDRGNKWHPREDRAHPKSDARPAIPSEQNQGSEGGNAAQPRATRNCSTLTPAKRISLRSVPGASSR